ncbi:hypothetical protein O9649_10345 [Achromobacter dolens]|uniref:hypothetical protein n=1 Tax=Achromobacter dolens TaxID=1287738 RepID=UPI0022B910FA|nr:hypothetical protein [Achromobacter dolens]MCZ8408188.1 hypothetical protein [Achromobacter dolens]
MQPSSNIRIRLRPNSFGTKQMSERWGTLEESIAVVGVAFGTAVAIWGWPSWPWPDAQGQTWAAWAGAAGSAGAAWAAYKAATLPHRLRKTEERHQGATDIVATRSRVHSVARQLPQITRMASLRHREWIEARTALIELKNILQDGLLLDPDHEPENPPIQAAGRVLDNARERVARTIRSYRTETRDELEAVALLLSAVPESSVRLFDARMGSAINSARSALAYAVAKSHRPIYVATVNSAIESALEELRIYEQSAHTADDYLAKSRKK